MPVPARLAAVFLFLCCALRAQAQPFTSSNLPLFVIDTQGQNIPDEPKITARLGVVWHEDGRRNALGDPFNHYDGWVGIERRGSTSQTLSPKKPYSIETRDAAGEDLGVSLLGLPEEADWVLIAPYSDKSLMRDVLAFEVARRTGAYASRTRFVELVLNGQYEGVYVLAEKIKRDKNRVDMANLKEEDVAGEEVTGGYLLKIDKRTGGEVGGWMLPHRSDTGHEVFIQYHDPKPSEIQPAQAAYIQQWMADFEAMLRAPDAGAHLETWIDVDSWISFLITNEVSRNVDGYRLSSFLWKEKDKGSVPGKLYMGPVWDFNLGFGNADYYDGANTKGWQADFAQPGDGFQMPFWWRVVRSNPAFQAALGRRWQSLRQGALHTDSLLAFVQAQQALLAEAQARNFNRWPVLDTYVWPNAYVGGSYTAEMRYLRDWLQQRLAWLDAQMPAATATTPDADFAPLALHLAPQPVAGAVATLTLGGWSGDRGTVALYDVLGRRVLTYDAAPTVTLAVDGLAPGLYLLRIEAEGRAATLPFVKAR